MVGDSAQGLIVFTIDKLSIGWNHIGKDLKLFDIDIEGREDVDMIPGDAADDADGRLVEMEFGAAVDGGSQILIPFDDHHFGSLREADHHIEAIQQSTHHIVAFDMVLLQHMDDHGGDRGLAMASAHHNSHLILALFIEIFGIGEDLEAEFFGFVQLWIIDAGVHA